MAGTKHNSPKINLNGSVPDIRIGEINGPQISDKTQADTRVVLDHIVQYALQLGVQITNMDFNLNFEVIQHAAEIIDGRNPTGGNANPTSKRGS